MKNNKIILGCIFSIILLMTLPSVPAVEQNVVIETNKQNIIKNIENIDIKELQKLNNKLKNADIEKEIKSIGGERSYLFLRLLLFILTSFTSMFIKIIVKSMKVSISTVVIVITMIITMILTSIGTIIGAIVGTVALITLGFGAIIYKIGVMFGKFDPILPQPEEE